MAEKGLVREVGVGVSVAVLLAAGGAVWNWSTHGGLVRALGGVTANDELKIVKAHILPDTHYSPKNDEQLLFNLRNKCDKRRYCDLGFSDNYIFSNIQFNNWTPEAITITYVCMFDDKPIRERLDRDGGRVILNCPAAS
jgi:hypothetical protein